MSDEETCRIPPGLISQGSLNFGGGTGRCEQSRRYRYADPWAQCRDESRRAVTFAGQQRPCGGDGAVAGPSGEHRGGPEWVGDREHSQGLRCAAEADQDVALDVVDIKRRLAREQPTRRYSNVFRLIVAPARAARSVCCGGEMSADSNPGKVSGLPCGQGLFCGINSPFVPVQHVALHGATAAAAGAGQTSTSRCILTSSTSCAGWLIGFPSIFDLPEDKAFARWNFQMQAQDARVFAVGAIRWRLFRAARSTTRRRRFWRGRWGIAMRCNRIR